MIQMLFKIFLLVLILPTKSNIPDWYLGKDGESCDEVCNAQGLACDLDGLRYVSAKRDWTPEELTSFFDIDGLTCTQATHSGGLDILPQVYAGGDCRPYPDSSSQSTQNTCSASRSVHTRVCKCATPLWLHRGKGQCPEGKNVGHESSEHGTLEQCRDKCEEYHENYFSLWKDGAATICGCYTDCDELDTSVDSESYEILSVTVRAELEKKDNEIDDLKNEKSVLISDKNDLTQNLNTCNSKKQTCETNLANKGNELIEMTTDRSLWRSRFEEVQRLEDTMVDHSDLALDKFPDQAELGIGNVMEQCNNGSIPSFMDRLVFIFIGAGLYALMNRAAALTKNRGDEYNAMLEI